MFILFFQPGNRNTSKPVSNFDGFTPCTDLKVSRVEDGPIMIAKKLRNDLNSPVKLYSPYTLFRLTMFKVATLCARKDRVEELHGVIPKKIVNYIYDNYFDLQKISLHNFKSNIEYPILQMVFPFPARKSLFRQIAEEGVKIPMNQRLHIITYQMVLINFDIGEAEVFNTCLKCATNCFTGVVSVDDFRLYVREQHEILENSNFFEDSNWCDRCYEVPLFRILSEKHCHMLYGLIRHSCPCSEFKESGVCYHEYDRWVNLHQGYVLLFIILQTNSMHTFKSIIMFLLKVIKWNYM